jgi:hypothetical protein
MRNVFWSYDFTIRSMTTWKESMYVDLNVQLDAELDDIRALCFGIM